MTGLDQAQLKQLLIFPDFLPRFSDDIVDAPVICDCEIPPSLI